MQRPYDIEADWIISSYCNFSCDYCFSYAASPDSLKTLLTAETIMRFLDHSDLTWLIHLTGGEPFFYPHFVDLCSQITQNHFISINSNLTTDYVRDFAQRINPERVNFVHGALHLAERERHRQMRRFVKHVNLLQANHFSVFVSSVMTPELFKRFPDDFNTFQSHGITIIPKAMRGIYQGKRYPQAYTERECELFREYSLKAMEAQPNHLVFPLGPPLIDLSLDREFIDQPYDFRGKLCDAGKYFVQIRDDGTITRCCSYNKILGRVTTSQLDLYDDALPCDTSCCPYFCQKFSHDTGWIKQ